MIKTEKCPKFSEKPENFRKNPLKNPKNLPPSPARLMGGRGFPKFFSQGGILAIPPCTPLRIIPLFGLLCVSAPWDDTWKTLEEGKFDCVLTQLIVCAH